METIYVLLIRNDVVLYFLCALVFVWFAGRLFYARHLLRHAVYGLERERGSQLYSTAMLMVIGSALVIGIVAYVNVQVAPTLPAEVLHPPPPTPNIFRTPLASPTPINIEDNFFYVTPTSPIVATVTLPPNLDAPSATRPITTGGNNDTNCSNTSAIFQPQNNQLVAGNLNVVGTATAEEFLLYQLAILGPETNFDWIPLADGQQVEPVTNGLLGNRNVTSWESGMYQIRLTVISVTGQEVGRCQIQIEIN